MKKIKSALITVIALILTCAISVAATYAYLYDKSETARNTISAGKVKISLSEARVNEDGQLLDVDGNVWTAESGKDKAPRVLNNHYKLLPNRTYIKDPTIYVEEGSEPCMLLLLIYMPKALENVIKYDSSSTDKDDFGVQFVTNGWAATGINENVNDANGNLIGRYMWFAYAEKGYPRTVSGGATVPFIESITIRSNATDEELEKASAADMEITAFAFQVEEWGDDINGFMSIINILNEAYDLYGN